MATRDDEIGNAYRRALLLARDRGFQLNRRGVERLYAAFAEAIARLAEEGGTAAMDVDRAEALRQHMELIIRALQRELVRLTEQGVGQTAIDVSRIHREVNRELVRLYGTGLAAGAVAARFDRVPLMAVQAMVSRSPGSAMFQTLINRRITSLAPEIDTFLDAAVARGVSAGRAAKDLARLMAREDPNLLRLLARADVLTDDLHRGAGLIDYGAYGLDEADTKALRELLYDARRITVSEINNALREANAASMRESPIVLASKWQLSGRHPEPDICDMLAEIDVYGYGPGVYPPEKWPTSPHPHCGCYAGRVIFRRPSEWGQPKPEPRPLAINPGARDIVSPWADQWTDRQAERYHQEFAAILAEAEDFSRRAA